MTIDLQKVPAFYHKYIQLVHSDDLNNALKKYQAEILDFLRAIDENKWDYKYAADKWSVKEVVQHIIDAERVFCYRALTFARKDKGPLPGFDEQQFARESKASIRSKKDLLDELEDVQKASRSLFRSFDEDQLMYTGIANNNTIQVIAIGYIIIGHSLHHKNILSERYLK